jgi:uncharacterized protein YjbJ (UPF0337 family)
MPVGGKMAQFRLTQEADMVGTVDKIKGGIKTAIGKITGDKRTEAEGKTDKAKGQIRDAAAGAKERVLPQFP